MIESVHDLLEYIKQLESERDMYKAKSEKLDSVIQSIMASLENIGWYKASCIVQHAVKKLMEVEK